MGMGLHIITQPDMVDDPPESVLACDSQGLMPGLGGEGPEGGNDGTSSAFATFVKFSVPWLLLVMTIVGL